MDIKSSDTSRRGGGLSTGMVAALGNSASAKSSASPASRVVEIANPVTAYPRPPFPRQQQEWPGLAGRMQPRPDHGETTYKGSGKLVGRKALITGGDSGMGRAAAIAFAREGADVAINYYPTEEEDAVEVIDLIHEIGRIGAPIPGDLRDEAFCTALVKQALK